MSRKSDISVSRTAIDALNSKHSAISECEYPVLPDHPAKDRAFRDLLSTMSQNISASKISRQTPLVNLGYAMRVSTILSTIHSFVQYHRDHDNDCELQLVLLGAGLDVTGIWGAMLTSGLTVIEIDVCEICRVKAEALKHLNDAIHINALDDSDKAGRAEGLVVSAKIDTNPKGIANEFTDLASSGSEYVLLEMDLRDDERVRRILSTWWKNDSPTLIVSELVLSYLGETPVDRLLRRLSSVLHQQGSYGALVAWEALGPTTGANFDSVVNGFRRSYCDRFVSKLQRGTADSDASQCQDAPLFLPLGSSCVDVQRRLGQLGFEQVNACLAGTAVASCCPIGYRWTSMELFDEHADLNLHLRSYFCVCAFAGRGRLMLRQCLCPWTSDGCPPISVSATDGSKIWLASIERDDEEQVRDLFTDSYHQYCESHRSIRKMVKAALKTDLQESCTSVSGTETSLVAQRLSSIQQYYRSRRGFFLVVLSSDDEAKNERRVVGAIGVRRLGVKERSTHIGSLKPEGNTPVFEVHRLMVDSKWQRRGIGAALLRRAEDLVMRSCGGDKAFHLLATTPTILESANSFYVSHGFVLNREVLLGELSMRTYHKTCDYRS